MLALPVGRLSVIAFAAALSACASSQEWRAVDFRAVDDTVVFQRSDSGASFSVRALITNNSSQDLYYGSGCGASLERDLSGEWKHAWSPICINSSGIGVLAPHDSVAFTVTPYGFTAQGTYPQLSPLIEPGRFRLTVWMGFKQMPDPSTSPPRLEERASSPFIVRYATP
jgi:hypothetical protein